MEKINIKVYESRDILSSYSEYKFEDIDTQIKQYFHGPYDYFTIEAESTTRYGDSETTINVVCYRKETDEELEARKLAKDRAEADANAKKKQDAEKRRLEKEKQNALLADPEYQQYLELHEKFKK